MAEMDRNCLATASGCIRFTLATASDQNCCTNNYIRSGYFKGVWQLPLTQNFCARPTDDFHSLSLVLVPAQNFLEWHKIQFNQKF
jgi:hypothetical protein